jgi:hypothetical protein
VAAIVEAFPTLFLAALIPEKELLAALGEEPVRKKSDIYWKRLVAGYRVQKLLDFLLPGRCFANELREFTDHEHRAAIVCALTALTVAKGHAVGVGDPDDGDIFLPPKELWGVASVGTEPWAEAALRHGIASLQRKAKAGKAVHPCARVRRHGRNWMSFCRA